MTGPAASFVRWLVPQGIEPEQLARLMRVTPMVAVMSTIGALLVSVVNYDGEPCPTLRDWLVVFCIVSGARAVGGLVFVRSPAAGTAHPQGWRVWGLGSTLVHAAMWGLLSAVLVDAGTERFESILHIVLAAVAMGSAVHLSGMYRVLVSFVGLTLGPLIVRDLVLGGPYHLFLAGLSFLIGVYALLIGRNQSRALNEILAQRRRNAELVEALRRENERSDAARRTAEEASAAKTRFLAAANHDLRQPLHAMGLLAQTLRSPGARANVAEVSGHLLECVDGMTQVVDDLLDITRLDVGDRAPQWSAFALDELLAETCRPYESLARAKGLPLVVQPQRVVVRSDRALLARVVSNLVSNAIRYTPAGAVRIVGEVREGEVQLRIEDSGIGIAPEQLPRIFEEFYQVGNPARDRRLGLGLGLATVRRLSDKLSLQVSVQSTPGQGTVFRLVLPLATPAESAAASSAVHAASVEAIVPLPGSHRVLVVEDDADSRHALVGLLQSWGCAVRAAACEDDAVALLVACGFRPDLLIVDLRLPDDASGIDAIQALRRAAGTEVPAVIVTGDVGSQALGEAQTQGFVVLTKPVRPMQLRAFLKQALATS